MQKSKHSVQCRPSKCKVKGWIPGSYSLKIPAFGIQRKERSEYLVHNHLLLLLLLLQLHQQMSRRKLFILTSGQIAAVYVSHHAALFFFYKMNSAFHPSDLHKVHAD